MLALDVGEIRTKPGEPAEWTLPCERQYIQPMLGRVVQRLAGIAGAAGLLALTGCNLLRSVGLGDERVIVARSSALILAWDPPPTDIPGHQTEVSAYEVYFRSHGQTTWEHLGEIPADGNPTFTVEHAWLGDGLYDFAVCALTQDGRISALHSSLDNYAQPFSGWYVFWQKSE
jgi:hypothetical protein